MANEILKNIFKDMYSTIIASINPDSVVDALLSKSVIGTDDNLEFVDILVQTQRCRQFLSLLSGSSHDQAFIHLRLMLLKDYSWIVDDVDKRLKSSRLLSLPTGHTDDGKLIL